MNKKLFSIINYYMNNNPIGIFDSGVGGLSILKTCQELNSKENFVYLHDKSGMPYGNKTNDYLISRISQIVQSFVNMQCKMVVFACNTATNVAIEKLRTQFSIPLIGVEPPILPAINNSFGGAILILVTEATANQSKFKTLIEKCKKLNKNIIVAPQANLATLIEKNYNSLSKIKKNVYKILSEYKNIESVVLGCTHYYYIKDYIEMYYQSKVNVYDANLGVAKRVRCVLKDNNIENLGIKKEIEFIFN